MSHHFKRYGSIIRNERKYRNLSQIDLSKLFSVDQSTISRLENGTFKKVDLYEVVLNYFGYTVFSENKQLESHLQAIYQAMDFYQEKKAHEIFEESKKDEELSYQDYVLKNLIHALFFLYTKQINEFKRIMKCHFSSFDYEISDKMNRYIHLLKGSLFFIDRKYKEAFLEYKKVIPILAKNHIEDDVFYYVIALTSIRLGYFNTAQCFIEQSKISSYSNGNIVRFIHLEHLLSYIYFYKSNYEVCIEKANYFIQHANEVSENDEIILETKLYIGASYLILKQPDKARPYFLELVENKTFIMQKNHFLIYSYLLRCVNDDNKAIILKTYKNSVFYQQMLKREEIEALVYIENVDNFKLFCDLLLSMLKEEEQLLPDIHLKIIHALFIKHIWNRRMYTIYKKLNDYMLISSLKEYVS